MDVVHIYKTNHLRSSRIFNQLNVDSGSVIDGVAIFGPKIIYKLLKSRGVKVIFHQHAMLLNMMLFYFFNKLFKLNNAVFFDCHDINELGTKNSLIRYGRFFFFDFLELLSFKVNIPTMSVSRCICRYMYFKHGKVVAYVSNIPNQRFKIRNVEVESNELVYFGQINEDRLSIELIKKLTKSKRLNVYGYFAVASIEYQNAFKLLEQDGALVYHGQYNPSELGAMICKYEASLLVFPEKSINIRYCMPNKLFQSLSSNVPCIISDNLFEIKYKFKSSTAVMSIDSYLESPFELRFDSKAIDIMEEEARIFSNNYKMFLSLNSQC